VRIRTTLMAPFRIDLVTLLVTDLTVVARFYCDQLGASEIGRGLLPAALALKLGQARLGDSPWVALQPGCGAAAIRLISDQGEAPDKREEGWDSLIIGGYPGARQAILTDPAGHRLHLGDGSGSLSGVTVGFSSLAASAGFYQGLLGAKLKSGQDDASLLLGSDTRIALTKPVLYGPRPLSVRLCLNGSDHEVISRLTQVPRCLSGPQDEIIELI